VAQRGSNGFLGKGSKKKTEKGKSSNDLQSPWMEEAFSDLVHQPHGVDAKQLVN